MSAVGHSCFLSGSFSALTNLCCGYSWQNKGWNNAFSTTDCILDYLSKTLQQIWEAGILDKLKCLFLEMHFPTPYVGVCHLVRIRERLGMEGTWYWNLVWNSYYRICILHFWSFFFFFFYFVKLVSSVEEIMI